MAPFSTIVGWKAWYALHMPALPVEEEAPINTDDLFSTMEVDAAVTNANGDFAFRLIDDDAAAAAAAQEGGGFGVSSDLEQELEDSLESEEKSESEEEEEGELGVD